MRSSACSASASLAPVERLTFSEALGRPSTSAASWITPRCQRRTWGLLVVALPANAAPKLRFSERLISFMLNIPSPLASSARNLAGWLGSGVGLRLSGFRVRFFVGFFSLLLSKDEARIFFW